MKRLLLVLGAVVALAGCGGGGGGGSTTPIPNNPGNPGGSTPSPSPSSSATPLPTATNAPQTVVVVATSSPIALAKTAINPGANSTNSATATVTGQGMSAGAALYATVSSNDKSGSTCLVLIPQGSTSGTACSYPKAGSTPAPVGVTHSGDQVAVQYNNGPTPPTGSFNVTVTANGGTSPANPLSINYPAPVVGQNASGSIDPWGGGIVYYNGNIYITQNSATSPIGVTSYSNGTAGASVTNLTTSGTLTNAPAGGLVLVGSTLYGTEQNTTKAFSVSTSGGGVTEYNISCPSSGNAGSGSAVLGPQTGITTDGSNVYVLCADVANKADGAHNTVNEIAAGGTVTSCVLNSGGGSPAGPFANGAVYANNKIYSEEVNSTVAGGGAGGASSGAWISIPVNPLSSCGNFTEFTNANITGSGNVWLMPDGNLYSETDNLMASPAFSGATAANPAFNFFQGGGGLAMDSVLGSGFFVGTADNHDAQILTKWTGGTMITIDSTKPSYVALSPGGTAMSTGTCEVAFNQGGGMGIVQLPDGKFAWPVATDGLETGRNYLCFLNP